MGVINQQASLGEAIVEFSPVIVYVTVAAMV